MDRRAFFRKGVDKAAEMVVKHADAQAAKRALHWVRPPFALNELEFLVTCTRCGECVKACPHNTVFPLPARLGAQVVGTPALDLLNKACHLCEDWPCVTSCEPNALIRPDEQDEAASPLPRLAYASINTGICLPYSGPECGACASSCPVPGAMTWDLEKPRIEPELCLGCALCRESCIVEPKAVEIR
jgi:ferredoxin-type protein NapG